MGNKIWCESSVAWAQVEIEIEKGDHPVVIVTVTDSIDERCHPNANPAAAQAGGSCTECGTKMAASQKFCSECGNPQIRCSDGALSEAHEQAAQYAPGTGRDCAECSECSFRFMTSRNLRRVQCEACTAWLRVVSSRARFDESSGSSSDGDGGRAYLLKAQIECVIDES